MTKKKLAAWAGGGAGTWLLFFALRAILRAVTLWNSTHGVAEPIADPWLDCEQEVTETVVEAHALWTTILDGADIPCHLVPGLEQMLDEASSRQVECSALVDSESWRSDVNEQMECGTLWWLVASSGMRAYCETGDKEVLRSTIGTFLKGQDCVTAARDIVLEDSQ